MSVNKTEIEFLESYFKFYTSKGSSIDNFKRSTTETLVNSGQVSIESLNFFCDLIEKELTIKIKEVQIEQIRKELIHLKKEVDKIKMDNDLKPKTPSKDDVLFRKSR